MIALPHEFYIVSTLRELNNHIKVDIFRLGWHKQQTATSVRSRENWHTQCAKGWHSLYQSDVYSQDEFS